jgi:23S rRNA pseudouridine2605 synthase
LEIVLEEGRNREIRRMLARVGHKVLHLRRVALGPIRLGDLPPGGYRELSHDQLRALRALVKGGPIQKGRRRAARRPHDSPAVVRRDLPGSRRKGTVLTDSERPSGGRSRRDVRRPIQKRPARRRTARQTRDG